MQIASELLGLTPPAPLSAVLVARPVRVCVFVPDVDGVPWQRLVEHALAAQVRVWGGGSNLVVPVAWDLADDELFWRLVDRFDPDVIGMYVPTFADAAELAPDRHGEVVSGIEQRLRDLDIGEDGRLREIERLRESPFWEWDLPPELEARVVERLATLWIGEGEPRSVWLNVTMPPQYPLTDVAHFTPSIPAVLDIKTNLGDVDQLMLTQTVGRVLPSLRTALEERGVAFEDMLLDDEFLARQHVWPRPAVRREVPYPGVLPETGLARRILFADRDHLIVVVGDSPRDFFLYHALNRVRPHVYWLPAARLDDSGFLGGLIDAVRVAIRTEIGGGDISVTTADDAAAATAARQALTNIEGQEIAVADWRTLLPNSYVWAADARSERRVSLLRHEGETQELPTPVPVSVSSDDPMQMRWMVDVEIQGWTPARNPFLAEHVFSGVFATPHETRTSSIGPSYFGLRAFVQAFLGLEGSTSRPRLRPRTVAEQVSEIVKRLGWEVSISDKGAYAYQSARLFGGVEGLAGALRSRPTRALLDAYLTPTDSNDPGIYLKDTRRRYLALDDAIALVENADVAALFSGLYDAGAVVRGHILKCEYCRAASFYALTEDQRFTCVRCRTDQRATRFSWLNTPEPAFRYALNEVVYQFLRNNGQLPLLAAYDHFVTGRGKEQRTLDIAFELDFKPPDRDLREHDIVATWGAELWLGEATGAATLEDSSAAERERLARLSESARSVGATGLLLITTSEHFSERTRQNVADVFTDPFWPQIVFCEGVNAGAAAQLEEGAP